MKTRPVEAKFFHAEGQNDEVKVALHNFENASIKTVRPVKETRSFSETHITWCPITAGYL